MSKCDVRGCDQQAVSIWMIPDVPLAGDYGVCTFHHQALNAGEKFDVSKDRAELLLGADAPLELITFKAHGNVAGDVITFIFGRDGVEETRVSARVSKEMLKRMMDWV